MHGRYTAENEHTTRLSNSIIQQHSEKNTSNLNFPSLYPECTTISMLNLSTNFYAGDHSSLPADTESL